MTTYQNISYLIRPEIGLGPNGIAVESSCAKQNASSELFDCIQHIQLYRLINSIAAVSFTSFYTSHIDND